MHYPDGQKCDDTKFPYIVQPEDRLYTIARNFDTTVSALVKSNPHINPYSLLVGQHICISDLIHYRYTNAIYKVSLVVPRGWKKVDDTKYEGDDGFFQVSAISSWGNIDDVCTSEAFHKLKPYGSHPTIKRKKIQGEDACIILPSHDQSKEMLDQGAFIVKYPHPIEISASSYNYFILWADKHHLEKIGNTLNFL